MLPFQLRKYYSAVILFCEYVDELKWPQTALERESRKLMPCIVADLSAEGGLQMLITSRSVGHLCTSYETITVSLVSYSQYQTQSHPAILVFPPNHPSRYPTEKDG
jgi:hypothetical protein